VNGSEVLAKKREMQQSGRFKGAKVFASARSLCLKGTWLYFRTIEIFIRFAESTSGN